MQHSRYAHVIHVRPLAEHLRDTADPRVRFADAVAFRRSELEGGIAREAELFAEERMTPRLARERAAVVHRLARGLNRVDDAAVARAAANVAVERLCDGLADIRLPLLNQ